MASTPSTSESGPSDGLQYTVAYYAAEDGWFTAQALDFPGAVTQGRTLKSAWRMVRDALRLLAASLVEEGQPLPKPDPRAGDSDAAFQEKVPLRIRVQ